MSAHPDTRQDEQEHVLHFRLNGQVDSADFAPWMKRHAGKLGVRMEILYQTAQHMSLRAAGQKEMVEAFALATSLGPSSVSIDTVEFSDGSGVFWSAELSHESA